MLPCCTDEFCDILNHQHSRKVKSDCRNRQNDSEAVSKIPIVRPEIVFSLDQINLERFFCLVIQMSLLC
jgi:hypothetical protein